MTGTPLRVRLNENSDRQRLASHGFFAAAHSARLDRRQVGVFLGQWWHPLHYFPTFLAHCAAVLPDIGSKCAAAKILYQETGCGNARNAHEIIFVETMERVGFPPNVTTRASPFSETEVLVDAYRSSARDRCAALGSLFATEVTDLVMVSAIGVAVRRVTSASRLDWVDIHVVQESDHVEQAGLSLLDSLTDQEQDLVVFSAERMWRLWGGFFDRLQAEMFE